MSDNAIASEKIPIILETPLCLSDQIEWGFSVIVPKGACGSVPSRQLFQSWHLYLISVILSTVQFEIFSFFFQKFFVGAALHNPSLVQDDDQICIPDG